MLLNKTTPRLPKITIKRLIDEKKSLIGKNLSSNKSFSTETSERYALALFELCKENSELDKVESNISDLLRIYDDNAELKNFLKNPTQSFSNQIKIVNQVSDMMKFSKTLNNFLLILVTKRRILLETLGEVLEGPNKIILDGTDSGSGVVPYLPLPELTKKGSSSQ